jgi:hypothetical protein
MPSATRATSPQIRSNAAAAQPPTATTDRYQQSATHLERAGTARPGQALRDRKPEPKDQAERRQPSTTDKARCLPNGVGRIGGRLSRQRESAQLPCLESRADCRSVLHERPLRMLLGVQAQQRSERPAVAPANGLSPPTADSARCCSATRRRSQPHCCRGPGTCGR